MIRLDDILQATGARLHGRPKAREFSDFSFDSRTTQPGQLFLAVVTETGDGHDYITQAVRAGASGILCERPPEPSLDGVTCLLVEDTRRALLDYARYILAQRDLPVIGVTGSVGKTSTKEAIAAVLGVRWSVFSNYGSYNGRYGLPIALGQLRDDHILAVLELASDSVGEIRELAEVTRPKVGVVTSIGSSHLQFFGTLEEIAREKGALIEALPADGTAILNRDDPHVRQLATRTKARVLRYGCELAPAAASDDLVAEEVSVSLDGTAVRVRHRGEVHDLRIPYLGAQHAYTALAAAAVGLVYGLSWEEIAEGLERLEPLPGRTRLIPGVHGSWLLDDSYNASPESAAAALELLSRLPAERRIVLLGDISQLGSQASEAHRRLGYDCAAVADILITKGELASQAAEGAREAGMPAERLVVTYSSYDAAQALNGLLGPGDLVLIKGSAEARLEQVTREVLHSPEDVALLPRQTAGWQQVRLQHPGRPTWVEVDLRAIAQNVRYIADLVGPEVAVMAVLKADAYGHGAIKVARTALNNGASWLGVACLGEAITLREAGLSAPILSLGYTPAWQARQAILHDVSVTLYSEDLAEALSRAASDLGREAHAHIKVDTGMARLGLLPAEVVPFVRRVARLPGLVLEGIFTHFANADSADLTYTERQMEAFRQVLGALSEEVLLPPLIHAANSAAILRLPKSHFNMVRLGIAMYGLNPSEAVPCPPGFRPAMSFKCQVAQVKELPPDSPVGYGCSFRTERASRIAVIPVGYADGFRRGPQNWGQVLVRGRRAPIVGHVCMDQTMTDVTDIPGVRQGDEVVLIGRQGNDEITVDEVARRIGTVNYEVVSEILARVPRIV